MRRIRIAGLLSAFFTLTAVPFHALAASPNDYIRLPIVEEGEREIDLKSGIQRNRDGQSELAHSLGLGMGVNRWWFTELYAKYKREPGDSLSFDAWEIENRFQLTETGKYPVDLGFLLEIERPTDRTEGYETTYGPMLQKEWGLVQLNTNLFIQKHIKARDSFATEMLYQAQIKYRQSQSLEWGAQAFGSVGQWNDWTNHSLQEHKLGPALFGKVKIQGKQAFKWNAAYLVGTTNATPSKTLRFQGEYEF